MCKTDSEHDELMALVTRLQEQVAEVTAANEQLQRQLVEAQRGGRRQAAPFSKGKRSDKPKRPGRKPGTGMFSYRKPAVRRRGHRAGCGCASIVGRLPWMWRQP